MNTVSSWCTLCRRQVVAKDKTVCERCERLNAIGYLVSMAVARLALDLDMEAFLDVAVSDSLTMQMFCSTLDAIAFLMEERSRYAKRMRQSLREEDREGQRAARDAYQEGKRDGHRGDEY